MKIMRVVAAIIIEDGKVFATQRGYGDFKGGWEFPGGKIEDGETPKAFKVHAGSRRVKKATDSEVQNLRETIRKNERAKEAKAKEQAALDALNQMYDDTNVEDAVAASINDEIDELRHAATSSLISRNDVIIVASVSCIYGLGDKEDMTTTILLKDYMLMLRYNVKLAV